MSFSLNEVEATAKRAARGAGYSWGLAEEAAKATRWLCARGLPGCDPLTNILEAGFAKNIAEHSPQSLSARWQGHAQLCPLSTGAVLSDCAVLLKTEELRLESTASPMLLLPFVAAVAHQINTTLTIESATFCAKTDGEDLSLEGDFPPVTTTISVRQGGPLKTTQPHQTRATPDPEAWAILNRFAKRTYAPATEESRLLGAGAGVTDND